MRFISIIFLTFLSCYIYGQTLFIDNIDKNIWTTSEKIIEQQTEINLSKLKIDKDSIKADTYLIEFNDKMLIYFYDSKSGKDSLIEKLRYSFIKEPYRFEIEYKDNSVKQYEIGINSSGNFASLHQTKDLYACFETILNKEDESKDGFKTNGYVIEIPYEKSEKIIGKRIQISGEILIVKGIKNDAKNQLLRQGRYEDTKYIINPKFTILN